MSDSEHSDNEGLAPAATNNSNKGARKRVAAGDKPDADKLPVPTPSRPCTLDTKILAHCTLVSSGIDGAESVPDHERRQRIKAESATPADVWAHTEFSLERDLWVFEHNATGEIVWGTPCRQGKNREKEPDCKRGTYRMYAPATMLANPTVKVAHESHDESLFEGVPMCTVLTEAGAAAAAAAPKKAPAAPAQSSSSSSAAAPRPPRVRKPVASKSVAQAVAVAAPSMSYIDALKAVLPRGDAPRTTVEFLARIALQVYESEDNGRAILEPATSKEAATTTVFETGTRSRQECLDYLSKYFSSTYTRVKNGESAVDAPFIMTVRALQFAFGKSSNIFAELLATYNARTAVVCAERDAAFEELIETRAQRDAAIQELAEARARIETQERELAMLRLGPNTLRPSADALRASAAAEIAASTTPAAPKGSKRVPKGAAQAKKRLIDSDDDSTVEPVAIAPPVNADSDKDELVVIAPVRKILPPESDDERDHDSGSAVIAAAPARKR